MFSGRDWRRYLSAAVFVLLTALGGCSSKPKPWREERTVGDRFRLVEWMRGTKERSVPVGTEIDGGAPAFLIPDPGLAGLIQRLESGDRLTASAGDGEPHGFTVELTEATVYVKADKEFRQVRKFDGDVRFWPSPDGTKLLRQNVSRDTRIEIVHASGAVRRLPEKAVQGIPDHFNKWPLAFVRWTPDSVHVVALSLHPDTVRGYPYLAKWRVHTETGDRALLGEHLLLLSEEVNDWRLVEIAPNATAEQVRPVLRKLALEDATWARKAAQRVLDKMSGTGGM